MTVPGSATHLVPAIRAYIERESIISAAINALMSLIAMTVVFGRAPIIPVWGFGNYAFDALPQSCIVALMATLVPGLIAARKRRAGTIAPGLASSRSRRALVVRAVVAGGIGALLGTAFVATALAVAGVAHLAWTTAAVLKLIYGGALGYAVTRITLPASIAG